MDKKKYTPKKKLKKISLNKSSSTEKSKFYRNQNKDIVKGIEKVYIGVVDSTSKDFAYIMCKNKEKDIKILRNNLLGAFHKDTVQIEFTDKKIWIVTSVIKRNSNSFVGKFIDKEYFGKILDKDLLKHLDKNISFIVKIDGKKYYDIIHILKEDILKAKNNDKVIIEITEWPKKKQSAKAKVLDVLGKSGDHLTEMNCIIYQYHLPRSFPEEIKKESKKINHTITTSEISKRKDFRKIVTFTIDPEHAKDYDDALSIRCLENGNYEIGIHIADVSHYIEENSPIDIEAQKRGNSIYLVDRTIPMLPEVLSNILCSLRPNEEKLTFSIVFEIDKNGAIYNKWIGKTIILSQKCFMYEEAQENIDKQSGEFYKELTMLNNIAKKMREKRFKEGSINFISPEYYIKLDEEGNPLNILKKKILDTNNLVEEYMLLANKEIANFYIKSKTEKNTFIYRTHDRPNEDKLIELKNFLKLFKYKFNFETKALSIEFNKFSKVFEKEPQFPIIQNISIRSMSKAIYQTENLPHFGLGFKNYTHFTSPIRRYSDLLVHRRIDFLLNKKTAKTSLDYVEIASHISTTERNAIDAERASIKYKQTAYLETLKGRTFEGMITYISEKSLFIELRGSGCEGYLPFSEMQDDYYILDKSKFFAVGRKKKRTFNIGDILKVKVDSCDLDNRSSKFVISSSSNASKEDKRAFI